MQSKEIKYHFATIGALTERGGRVTTTTGGSKYCGLGLARVGDVVTYPDDSEAVIIDGAGCMCVIGGRPAALVGRYRIGGNPGLPPRRFSEGRLFASGVYDASH